MVTTWIAQASVSNYLLEYLYRLTPTKVTNVEAQLAVHEVAVIFMEPVDYRTITEVANALGEYISKPAGPT